MTFPLEYTGWDNYVNLKRTDEQYQQIKKEWKGAVDEYFGVEKTEGNNWRMLKDLDKRIYHIKGELDTLNQRINQITDCGHGKLKQMVTPLHQGNVIGRIEVLEEWRGIHKDHHVNAENNIEERIKELEERERHLTWFGESVVDRLNKLEEWKDKVGNNPFRGYYTSIDCKRDKMFQDKKMIDKQVWEEIRTFLTHITGEESKGLLRYSMIHLKTGQSIRPEWIRKINKLVEEQDK